MNSALANLHKRKLSVILLYRLISIGSSFYSFARKRLYGLMGATIGRGVKLGSIEVSIPEQVIIGDYCELENHVRLRVGGGWKNSSISIGSNTFIGHSTQINVGTHFKLGSDCLIAPMCLFSDAHHSFNNIDMLINQQICIYKPIEIEDDVWIGSGVMVLGGVRIGRGSVIAAGSVVTKCVPEYEVWAGIPAKKIKNRGNN